MNATAKELNAALAVDMGRFFDDPLGFVMYAYPWGSGPLKGFDGPFKWQHDFLVDLGNQIKERGFDGVQAVDAIRKATTSGHGIGKSALTAWLVDFIMSTRPHAQGTVTANTSTQLETKTWAQVAKWTKLCITSHWFQINTGRGSMKMYHVDYPESWYCSAQTCREENSEAFAGQHAVTSTSFYIFDEASAVPSPIWEVAEGGLTDGEPMFFAFGNPTKADGKFRECFGKLSHRWTTQRIDSRTVPITNKKEIQQWADDYGDDSDFFRVRVKGEFPLVGSSQLIGPAIVHASAGRVIPIHAYFQAPKTLGVDVARFGEDKSTIIRRQGVASFGLKKYRKRDTMFIANQVLHEIKEWDPDAVFIDDTGVGGGVTDRLRQLGYGDIIIPVNVGESAGDPSKYFNLRIEVWDKCRAWLAAGGCIPDDPELKDDLTGPEFDYNDKQQLVLERKKDMKKRGLASPDCAEALVLTFAQPVHSRDDRIMTLLEDREEEKYNPLNHRRRSA